jgi:hypothetical protein
LRPPTKPSSGALSNTKDTQHCTFIMSMITAASWVPRGFAAPFPQKYTLDEAEFERIAELAKLQLDDAQEDLKEAQEGKNGAKEDDKKDNDDEMKDDGENPQKKFVVSDGKKLITD